MSGTTYYLFSNPLVTILLIFRIGFGASSGQVDGEFYHAVNPESTSVYLYKKLQVGCRPISAKCVGRCVGSST